MAQDEVTNVLQLMQLDGFLGFSIESVCDVQFMEENIQAKLMDTDGELCFVYMSAEMKRRFEEHPHVLMMDGTHGTNAAGYPLVSLCILGK